MVRKVADATVWLIPSADVAAFLDWDHRLRETTVLLGGERFSKSAGVKLELNEAIDRFGPDAFRYYLLREVPFDTDGSFSWERFEQVYVSELANTWGNLGSRTIAMIEKYFEGRVPAADRTELDQADAATIDAYRAAMDGLLLHEGLRSLVSAVQRDGVIREGEYEIARGPLGAGIVIVSCRVAPIGDDLVVIHQHDSQGHLGHTPMLARGGA